MKGGFDMYRKVTPDLVVATFRGGVFSLIAVALMGCLAFVETWAFVGTGDIREIIDVELGVSPARINIEVEFPRLNCDDAAVELWRGKSRAATHGLERTLRVWRFDDATKRSHPYRKIPEGAKKAAHEVGDSMDGCKLQGYIAYEHTSPGTVAISAPAGSDLSHHVVDFTFGMPLTQNQARSLKSLPERYSKVVASTLQRIRYESPSRDKVFHHFVHVVPTKYQLAKRKGFTAFQLLHQSHLSHTDGAQEAMTRFGFDISPMTALVSNRSAKRWYDFVTSLLSIIGGAFTVVSLLERGAAALGG